MCSATSKRGRSGSRRSTSSSCSRPLLWVKAAACASQAARGHMGGHRLGCAVLLRVDAEDGRHHQRRRPPRRSGGRGPGASHADTRHARLPHPDHRPVLQEANQPLHEPRSRGHEAGSRIGLSTAARRLHPDGELTHSLRGRVRVGADWVATRLAERLPKVAEAAWRVRGLRLPGTGWLRSAASSSIGPADSERQDGAPLSHCCAPV